ncbi:MAG: DM13 domain-containing protein [Pseudonocardiales bacterium]|nr:DM13 domain-containing protein [Pseudonocardiales bacterium]
MLRRRPVILIAFAVLVVGLVVGLAVFEPWKLFVDRTVDEAAPVSGGPVSAGPVAAAPVAAGPVPTAAAPAVPGLLARGDLIAHEHASSGSVEVLRLSDGSRVLRLQDLRTSDGPNLHVWLTDAPVLPGKDGWYVFDDGRHVDLGPLKGNIGSSNYPIPADVDLAALRSVTIWCDRFNVSFAAAALA